MTLINGNLGFIKKDRTVTFIYRSLPVFSHDIEDIRTFRINRQHQQVKYPLVSLPLYLVERLDAIVAGFSHP